jgi:hypothetical protein
LIINVGECNITDEAVIPLLKNIENLKENLENIYLDFRDNNLTKKMMDKLCREILIYCKKLEILDLNL